MHAMEKVLAEVIVGGYLAKSLEPANDYVTMEYWSHNSAIWPDLSCVTMNLLPSH